jgi:hypothetical protein
MTSLFDAFPDDPEPAPPPRPARRPVRRPTVASYTCPPCGAREEVLEPAPAKVDCWNCKRLLSMIRWKPLHTPPTSNARRTTGAEEVRARRGE